MDRRSHHDLQLFACLGDAAIGSCCVATMIIHGRVPIPPIEG